MMQKATIATSVAIHATDLSSWKSTVERNLAFVHGATTLAQKLALLKSTCESMDEKDLTVRLLLHTGNYSQAKPANSFRRKTISVHSAHLFLCKKGCLQRALVNSFRGKAIQL